MRVGLPCAIVLVEPPSLKVEAPNETVPTSAGMVCTPSRLGASWIHSAEDSDEAYVTDVDQDHLPESLRLTSQLSPPVLEMLTLTLSPGLTVQLASPLHPLMGVSLAGRISYQALYWPPRSSPPTAE